MIRRARGGPDSAGQHVGPVLRTEQPHRPVVRVEHDALPHQHLVGAQRQHHPAGARVTPYRGHHELARAGDDLAADVVDRVDVPPGLGRGVRARLDDAQVDPVAEGRAALQQEDARVLGRVPNGARRRAGGTGPSRPHRCRSRRSGRRRHRAPVRDLPGLRRVGHRIQRLGHVRDAVAQHGRRRQLDPWPGSAAGPGGPARSRPRRRRSGRAPLRAGAARPSPAPQHRGRPARRCPGARRRPTPPSRRVPCGRRASRRRPGCGGRCGPSGRTRRSGDRPGSCPAAGVRGRPRRRPDRA